MSINNSIFNFLFTLSDNIYIAKFSLFLSYPFTYGIILAVAVWAIFFSKRKMYNSSLLFLSGLFSWIMAAVLKSIFMTSRPFHNLLITPLYPETGYSFPSQHMAIFSALAISMFLINKKAGLVFSFIAILVGISRIIIGVHYPIDILGGLIVGVLISLIFIEIYKKI